MFTLSSHISLGGTLRRIALVLVVSAAVVAAFLGSEPRSASAQTGGYNWPVKPFDRVHPVRGNFGDPRTSFDGPPTPETLSTGTGIFALHFGIDISVPDFTPVYPVRSGVASLLSGRTVAVDSGGGHVFEYWHIVPCVTPGQHVVAYKTILGRVMKGYEHVHFTERDNRAAVNPLAPGHLTPYADTTAPEVESISFRTSDAGPELLPESIHGRVVVVAQAADTPPVPVPGIWADLPVAPALLGWRVERVGDHRVVVPEHVAFDVRKALPRSAFWNVYARGSRQNASNFAGHKAWREPGVYLYKLCAAFDTARIPNGIYQLVVTAKDIRGNTSSSRQVFIVRNAQGV